MYMFLYMVHLYITYMVHVYVVLHDILYITDMVFVYVIIYGTLIYYIYGTCICGHTLYIDKLLTW